MPHSPSPTVAPSDDTETTVKSTHLSFAQLPLAPAAIENLRRLGYLDMTPIQAASLPLTLAGHSALKSQ